MFNHNPTLELLLVHRGVIAYRGAPLRARALDLILAALRRGVFGAAGVLLGHLESHPYLRAVRLSGEHFTGRTWRCESRPPE